MEQLVIAFSAAPCRDGDSRAPNAGLELQFQLAASGTTRSWK
jgi:hypothetical protein